MGENPIPMSGRVGLEGSQAALCQRFLHWQCLLRQIAVRNDQGRPSTGLRPTVSLPDETRLGPVTVLIIRREPEESTAQFRHIVLKTFDPADRYFNALSYLQGTYYQSSREFSDLVTALFALESGAARDILKAGRCTLYFEEAGQAFNIPCAVRSLEEDHPAFQATYWHNRLFNPAMPGQVRVLGFLPDWHEVTAAPSVE